MILHPPFEISSRLLPGLRLGGAWIQLQRSTITRDGRQRFRWYIDLPEGGEFTGDDLKSGVGGCDLQEAFVTLLSFLGACGESVAYSERTGREGDNADLFPVEVGQWARQNLDTISLAQYDIEGSEITLIEEP